MDDVNINWNPEVLKARNYQVNLITYEEPSFKIVHQTDKYEIRHYQERLAVQSTYTNIGR